MRHLLAFRLSLCVLLGSPVVAAAQTTQDPAVPRLMNISGVYRPADGQPAGPVATVTLSIYADQQGGSPVWQETQTVALDAQGRYSLLLGATRPDGIPAEVFNGDAAHWLGTMPGGNVGIGTFNAFPTITDKLQVFGDIRVGTAGTNGCLKNFAGTGIAGTCSSDRRLKKDITPFAPALDKVAALQPVTYFWRANEFPNRHFGNGRNYGLIAQDVEAVLPELVATESDGYKAIDYSELPLLTIQAVKELKAENDALKKRVDALEELQSENVALKQHLAEIERLLTNALGNAPRR